MESFESYRPLLFAIAYRMLGSAMDAEDIVQETYLRYQATAPETIQSHKAFLSTIVTRLCLNHLTSARVQRETYIGPWLPEPISTASDSLTLHDSLSMAFLVLLESLTPSERAVFLLREVFDYEYAEIAEMVGKEETACRQLFSRAKKHIAENRPRFKSSPEAHSAMLNTFLQAVTVGELEGLMTLLAEEVVMYADGGGKAKGAATRPLHGREAVAQFVLHSVGLPDPDMPYYPEIREVNGEAAILLRKEDGRVLAVVTLLLDEAGRIRELHVVGNPDKLRRL